MPPAELILWSKLKGRKLLGCKFRRQYGIDAYSLDFYSPEVKLAVELMERAITALAARISTTARRDDSLVWNSCRSDFK